MFAFLLTLLILDALLLSVVVLLQAGQGGGLASLGGATTDTVLGGRQAVTQLTKPGAEPHDVELNPRQVADISDAGLVVYLKGFQPQLDEVCRCASACGVHGHNHSRAWTGTAPVHDLKSFWGVLGCSCFAF